jgi:hypothetical protein
VRLPALLAVTCVISALPAMGASCGSYAVVGSNCVRTVVLGWGVAGGGAQSVITFLGNTAASAPVNFAISKLTSSLGTSYTGYFGVATTVNGVSTGSLTATTFTPVSVAPGLGGQVTISQTCFDANCVNAPPATFTGPFLSNMFSMVMTMTAASGADLDVTPLPLLTVQFLDANGLVTFQEQEQAVDVGSVRATSAATFSEGAAAASRYVYTGNAVDLPFTAFSVSNPSATTSVRASIAVNYANGNPVTTVALPSIPPLGAVGYLLMGRTPGDPLGLLPANVNFTAGADGIFHGTYGVVGASGPVIFLSQEFYGSSMLNAFIVP